MYCIQKNCTYKLCKYHYMNKDFYDRGAKNMEGIEGCKKRKPQKLYQGSFKIVTKTKKSTRKLKKVFVITTGETFNSVKEVSDKYGMSRKSVEATCRGEQKMTRGLEMKYLEEGELTNVKEKEL